MENKKTVSESYFRGMRQVTDAVFGLALGLGAYSLTSFPISSFSDILDAVYFFGITYIFIVVAWITLGQFFRELPLTSKTFFGLNMIVVFLAALSPFLMRVLWLPALKEVGCIIFPAAMTVIFLILGVFYEMYILGNKDRLEVLSLKKLKVERNVQFIIISFFLVTIVVPLLGWLPTVFPPAEQRPMIWLLGLIVAGAYDLMISRLLR